MKPILHAITSIFFLFAPIKAQNRPNHLLPIDPRDYQGYHNAVYRILLPHRISEAWMVAFPTFESEYAICICLDRNKNDEIIEPKKYLLIQSKLNTQAWPVLAPPPPPPPGLENKAKRPSKSTLKPLSSITPIQTELAEKILAAWQTQTKNAHYGDNLDVGCEGIMHHFFSRPGYFGRCWSPTEGKPQQLAALADLLIQYTKTPNIDRAKIIQQIETTLENLR